MDSKSKTKKIKKMRFPDVDKLLKTDVTSELRKSEKKFEGKEDEGLFSKMEMKELKSELDDTSGYFPIGEFF